MKPFELNPKMLTMRGVFYPSGYLFVMFPRREDAERVEHDLLASGYSPEYETQFLTAEDVMGKVVSTVGNADSPLPSAGSEAATVRHYAEFAAQGHCALLVHAPTEEDGERVMNVVRRVAFSIAEKYRMLVIQDMA